jgi:hypothetical protein
VWARSTKSRSDRSLEANGSTFLPIDIGDEDTRSLGASLPIDLGDGDARSLGAALPIDLGSH